METKERRRYIDYRQGSDSGSSLLDRRDVKDYIKYIDREINYLEKDVGATSRFQKIVALYEIWIGEVFSYKKGESTENLLYRNKALNNN